VTFLTVRWSTSSFFLSLSSYQKLGNMRLAKVKKASRFHKTQPRMISTTSSRLPTWGGREGGRERDMSTCVQNENVRISNYLPPSLPPSLPPFFPPSLPPSLLPSLPTCL